MAKRPNGEGTVFFDKKANRYRAQFYDLAGKRRALSSRTSQGAHKKLREAIQARDKGMLGNQPSTIESLGDFLDSWHSSKSLSNWAFKTIERNRLDINHYIKPYLGHVRLDLLKPQMISEAYIQIKNDKKLSDSSLLHVHVTLKSALSSAKKLQKIFVNPMEVVDAPKVRKGKIDTLSKKDFKLINGKTKQMESKWSLMWSLTTSCGIRQGEVLGLTWDNVDLENESICIKQQLQRQTGNGLVLKPLKTDIDARYLFLTKAQVALFRKWKIEQSKEKLLSKSWGDIDFVFTNSVGKPVEPRKTAKLWAKLLSDSSIDHIKLHGARHTFATIAINHGLDVKTVSHYLGHKDSRTTIHIYQQVTEATLKDAAIKISELAI